MQRLATAMTLGVTLAAGLLALAAPAWAQRTLGTVKKRGELGGLYPPPMQW